MTHRLNCFSQVRSRTMGVFQGFLFFLLSLLARSAPHLHSYFNHSSIFHRRHTLPSLPSPLTCHIHLFFSRLLDRGLNFLSHLFFCAAQINHLRLLLKPNPQLSLLALLWSVRLVGNLSTPGSWSKAPEMTDPNMENPGHENL